MAIEINGLVIENLGNGTDMKIKWSVVDPSNISLFIIERHDRHLRRWVAYDGFHGSISANEKGSFSNPSYEVTAQVKDSPNSQQSFRVKAIFKDKTESSWVSASEELIVVGDSEAPNRSYYIYNGLSVSAEEHLEAVVSPGSAVFAGDITYSDSPVHLSLPTNSKHIIFITESGIISSARIDVNSNFSEIKTYEKAGAAIRLANVTVGVDNKLTVEDTRSLWHPQNVIIEQSSSDRMFVNISWNEVLEPNTYQYKVYKSIGTTAEASDFYEIATIDANTVDYSIENFPNTLSIGYEDSDNEISKGKTYWYKVATVDFDGRVSPASAPQSAHFELENQPIPPKNLSGDWGTYLDSAAPLLYLDLSWEQDNEEELGIEGYNVYLKRFGHWVLQEVVYKKSWRHSGISNGSTCVYAITSFNNVSESELSIPLQIEVRDTTAPSAPQIDPLDPISTGGSEDGVWAKIKWLPVTTNDDAEKTAITDLLGYNIYQVLLGESGQKEYSRIKSVESSINEIQIDMPKHTRGQSASFVVTAYDYFSNESAKSSETTIVLGGSRPKLPTFTARYQNDYGVEKVIIDIDKVTEDVNGDPLVETSITSYIIYKGRTSYSKVEFARVFSSDDSIQHIDLQVSRGNKYYYTVRAIDSNGNTSDAAIEISVDVGDFVAPPPPLITDYGTLISESQVSNFIKFTMQESDGLKGSYVYVSENGSSFEQIGFVYFSKKEEYEYVHSRNIKNGSSYQYLLTGVDFSNNVTSFELAARTDVFMAGDTSSPHKVTVKLESVWENQDAGVRLSWDSSLSENITEYIIYRSEVTGLGPYKIIDTITSEDSSSFEYIDQKLVNRSQYWYKVIAVNKLGVESDGCNYVEGYGVPVLAGDISFPEKPKLLHKYIVYDNFPVINTSIAWISTDQTIKSYEVYFSSNENYGYSLLLETEATSFTHNISYGDTIYYKIIAVSDSGNKSEPLVEHVVAIKTRPPEIIQDLNYEIIQQSGGVFKANILWEYEPDAVFKAYKVYSVLPDDSLELVSTVLDPLVKIYTIEGLKMGRSYSFAVTCIDKFGNEKTSGLETVTLAIKDLVPPNPIESLSVKSKELGIELSWKEPVLNTDRTNLVDLAGYEIYYSPSAMGGEPKINGQLIARISSNGFYHQVGGNKPCYYAIRAYDTSENYSTFVESEEVTSQGLSGSAFDTILPVKMDAPLVNDYGVIPSEVDETELVFVSISWDPSKDDNISHYNIYLDNQYFAQTKSTLYTLYGLRTGEPHFVKVSAVDKTLNEGQLSDAAEIPAIGYTVKPPPPIAKSIRQYLGGIIVEWEEPKKNGVTISHIKGYELEYAETDGEDPSEELWEPLSKAKTTYNIHGRLKYNKYYYYRIRTIDSFGNLSDWVYFRSVGDGKTPAQTGESDIACESVSTDKLIVDSVKATHIAADSIKSRHVQAEAIIGKHIAGKSINASHLIVEAGGRNLVSNSAFGMKKLDSEKLDVSWKLGGGFVQIIDKSKDENIPIVDHAIEFYSANTASSSAVQKLETKERLLSVSFNIIADHIIPSESGSGIIVDLCSFDGTEYTRLSDDYFLITGSTENGWTLLKQVFYLPEYENIYLRIMLNEASGLARLTCINVEEGDLPSKWYPKDGETYGALGNVQINPSGIIVENGKIKIVTDSDNNGNAVVIDSEGICAGNREAEYAKMTKSGFSSVGGAFSIMTGNDEDKSGVSFDASGISAKGEDGKETFNLCSLDGSVNLYGGKFSITTAKPGEKTNSYLELNGDGIELFSEETLFKVDSKLKTTTIGGSFKIQSNSNPLTDGGFEFSPTKFKAYSADKKNLTFLLDADNGNVSIGSTLILSSSGLNENGTVKDKSSSRFVISTGQIDDNLPGFYSYNDEGLGFSLTGDGKAQFRNGSITINGGDNSVTFDSTGITGKGFYLTSSGLKISDANITNGNIVMDSDGMTIDDKGGQGITVIKNKKTIVQINSEGIQVLKGKGINIAKGGSLTISDGATAIDFDGINASTINTGTLKIDSSTGPGILVGKDDIIINSDGITINNGKLSLFSDHGQSAIIENGKITANALDLVTTPGLNLLRNGTGSFDLDSNNIPDFWVAQGATLEVVTKIQEADPDSQAYFCAGISSKYSIKASGEDSVSQIYQDIVVDVEGSNRQSAIKPGREYTAIFNVYLVSGSVNVSIVNAKRIDGSDPTLPIIESNKWVTKKILFKAWEPTGDETESTKPIERFLVEMIGENSLAYLTDLMVVEGNIKSGYFRHNSEMLSGDLVSIRDGKFLITGANSKMSIDKDGIIGPNFSLMSDGLSLDYGEENAGIRLDKDGLLVGDAGPNEPYVLIDKDGLSSNGMFTLTSSSDSGSMKINSGRIFMKNLGQSIDISPSGGIKAIGSSAFEIKTSDGDSDGISLTPEAFKVFKKNATTGEVKDTVIIGKLPENVVYAKPTGSGEEGEKIGYGVYVNNGNFLLESSEDEAKGIASMKISPSAIEIINRTGKKNYDSATQSWKEEIYTTLFNSRGLKYLYNGEEYSYNKRIYIPKAPVEANVVQTFPGFTSPPRIIVVPAFVQTFYSGNGLMRNSFLEFGVNAVTKDSFIPVARMLYDSKTFPDYTVQSSGGWTKVAGEYKILHNGKLIIETAQIASRFIIEVKWFADKAHVGDVRDFVSFTVEFRYFDQNSSSWSAWQDQSYFYKEGDKYKLGGSSNRGSVIVSSPPLNDQKKIQARVSANINNGHQTNQNYVKVTGIEYTADGYIQPSRSQKVWYIAIDDTDN